MARLHLIELEDQAWFPAPIRDGGTDFLGITQELGHPFANAAPLLARALERSGTTQVVDLCSGGAGPWLPMRRSLQAQGCELPVLLTDLHPNQAAFARAQARSQGAIRGHPAPVDATAVPEDVRGFRTLFNGFHHFRPDQAVAILRSAVARNEGIGVFEAVERSPLALLGILPAALTAFLVMPLVRPLRWSNLVFTYLLPAIPLLVLFDGLVSCLRVYSPEELRAMVAKADPEARFDWEIGRARGKGPSRITYLLGTPRLTSAAGTGRATLGEGS
jgi:hypothetical protein